MAFQKSIPFRIGPTSSQPKSRETDDLESSTMQDIFGEIRSFLDDETTTITDATRLVRYLQHSPATAAIENALPAEIGARLAFANRVLAAMHNATPSANRHLTNFEMSVIFTLPLDQLPALETASEGNSALVFGNFSKRAEELVRVFLSHAEPKNSLAASSSQNKAQSDICLERDGNRCVLTGTSTPDVCYIVPLSVNSSTNMRQSIELTRHVLECITTDRQRLLFGKPGCSDQFWNMLSLNRQLHDWWRRGYFALKCLKVSPEPEVDGNVSNSGDGICGSVTLQFHWMPLQQTDKDNARKWSQDCPNERGQKWLRDWEQKTCYGDDDGAEGESQCDTDTMEHPSINGTVSASYAATGRLIQTGHVFKINMPSVEDGLRMKVMLDVQWACIRMASMSGAAGDPDFMYQGSGCDEQMCDAEDAGWVRDGFSEADLGDLSI